MATDTRPNSSIARLITSVSSLTPAIRFYRDILGLELRQQHGEFAWLYTRDDVQLMLHERPATPSDTGIAIGFAVDDLNAVVEEWRAAGGAIVDEPSQRPWGEMMAVVRDADGHIVCVSAR